MKTSIQDTGETKPINTNPPKKKYLRQTHKQTKNGDAKDKPIVAKPKARTDCTSYLIDVLWDDRLW